MNVWKRERDFLFPFSIDCIYVEERENTLCRVLKRNRRTREEEEEAGWEYPTNGYTHTHWHIYIYIHTHISALTYEALLGWWQSSCEIAEGDTARLCVTRVNGLATSREQTKWERENPLERRRSARATCLEEVLFLHFYPWVRTLDDIVPYYVITFSIDNYAVSSQHVHYVYSFLVIQEYVGCVVCCFSFVYHFLLFF